MQNVRQEKLLAMLCEREGWMTSRQLARLLGVSDRTIRSDVDAINKRITPPPIESNVRLGYRMMEDARTGLFAPEKKVPETEIPQTPGARCIYIIQKLLFEIAVTYCLNRKRKGEKNENRRDCRNPYTVTQ